MYPASEHRAKALSSLSVGAAFLAGDRVHERHDTDVELPFRQESSFFYLSGVALPNYALLVNLATKQAVLVAPNVDMDVALWCGMAPGLEELKAAYDVDMVVYASDMAAVLDAWAPEIVHTLPDTVTHSLGKYASRTDDSVLKGQITEARMIKTPAEIDIMRTVNRISSDAHELLMRRIIPGMPEHQLEADFVHACWSHGLKQQAYTPIVGAGENAAILHYNRNTDSCDASLATMQLVLVDAGAEMSCYASDITRTFPVSGKFRGHARLVYQAVLDMQNTVIAALKPGVNWEDMHQLAALVLARHLVAMNLLHGATPQQLVDNHALALFFPHGLGHLIGLDVHDVGGYPAGIERIQAPGLKYLRMRRRLEAGMVVTVEPGCYFSRSIILPALRDSPDLVRFVNMAVLEEYWSVGGVRIEDNVVITETGSDNLTTAVKEIDDIERLMAGAVAATAL